MSYGFFFFFFTWCIMFKMIFYIRESLVRSLRCCLFLLIANLSLIFHHCGASFVLLSTSLFRLFLLIHCLFTGQHQIHNAALVNAVTLKSVMQCDILNVCGSAAFGLRRNINAYWITEKFIWKICASSWSRPCVCILVWQGIGTNKGIV